LTIPTLSVADGNGCRRHRRWPALPLQSLKPSLKLATLGFVVHELESSKIRISRLGEYMYFIWYFLLFGNIRKEDERPAPKSTAGTNILRQNCDAGAWTTLAGRDRHRGPQSEVRLSR
jgi:hypothetical protein